MFFKWLWCLVVGHDWYVILEREIYPSRQFCKRCGKIEL